MRQLEQCAHEEWAKHLWTGAQASLRVTEIARNVVQQILS